MTRKQCGKPLKRNKKFCNMVCREDYELERRKAPTDYADDYPKRYCAMCEDEIIDADFSAKFCSNMCREQYWKLVATRQTRRI